jgi:WD40 repeat protein
MAAGSGGDPEYERRIGRGKVQIWDLKKQKEGELLLGHVRGQVFGLAFSPDSKTLASGCGDKNVCLWDMERSKLAGTLKGHTGAVTSVAISHDGKTLASCSADNTVKLWNMADQRLLTTLGGSNATAVCICFSPDGKNVVAGDGDGMIRVWDVGTGRLVDSFRAHDTWVSCLDFSPDGKTLASAKFITPYQPSPPAGEIRLWQVRNASAPTD